jgi:hypothetical protein
MSTPGTRSLACLTVAVALVLTGCSRAVDPVRLADAQLAVRVKTALVNDPGIGPFPIEVQVAGGMVRLWGRLDTDAQRQRAIDLARSVAGVRGVESALTVGAAAAPPEPAGTSPVPGSTSGAAPFDLFDPADGPPGDRRLLAVGASINLAEPTSTELDRAFRVSPLVRIGSGTGLGVALGFGWFAADLSAPQTSDPVGRLKVKPIMGGLGYDVRRERVTTGISLVGGVAFNSVDPDRRDPSTGLVVDVSDSLVLRPGMSVWVDLNSRTAFNVFAGYVLTRPRVTFLEQGRLDTRTVRADTGALRAGLVYKLF